MTDAIEFYVSNSSEDDSIGTSCNVSSINRRENNVTIV